MTEGQNSDVVAWQDLNLTGLSQDLRKLSVEPLFAGAIHVRPWRSPEGYRPYTDGVKKEKRRKSYLNKIYLAVENKCLIT